MNCSNILDMVYESETPIPLINQVQIWLHTIVCPSCSQEIERYQVCNSILREDFFPSSPMLEDSIMAKVAAIAAEEEHKKIEELQTAAGGFSTRGWIIAGIIIFVSFAAAYFGLDFKRLANESGISFLLPMGITFGIVLTLYSALFIGSHLKEFSERFGL